MATVLRVVFSLQIEGLKKEMCMQMHNTSLVVPLSLNSVIFSIFRIFFSCCVFSFSKDFLILLFQELPPPLPNLLFTICTQLLRNKQKLPLLIPVWNYLSVAPSKAFWGH